MSEEAEPSPVAEAHGSLADQVAQGVAKLIIEKGLRPGDSLPAEGALAATFSVSKPVVREGLSQLVGLGLIESRKGSVATVKRLTGKPLEAYFSIAVRQDPQGLRQAIELRRVLEEHVVKVAAKQATDDDIHKLRRCLGHLYITRDLDEEWAVADAEFHGQILEIAKNDTLGRVLTAINGALWETVSGVRAYHHPPDTLASYKRHEAIFTALEARDPEAAHTAMSAHFEAMNYAVDRLTMTLASDDA